MGVLAGAGEILSTGEDMAEYVRVLVGLRPFATGNTVERTLKKRAAGEGSMSIGYGWNIQEAPKAMWAKTGLTYGFTALVAFQREPKVGVAILSNRGGHKALLQLSQKLLDALALTSL